MSSWDSSGTGVEAAAMAASCDSRRRRASNAMIAIATTMTMTISRIGNRPGMTPRSVAQTHQRDGMLAPEVPEGPRMNVLSHRGPQPRHPSGRRRGLVVGMFHLVRLGLGRVARVAPRREKQHEPGE